MLNKLIISRNCFIITLVLLISMYIVNLFNISYLSSAIGFLLFIFVPGFFLQKILRLGNGDYAKVTLFSVGLSIALDMLIGLAVNALSPLIGTSLASVPLVLNITTLILSLFAGGISLSIGNISLSYPILFSFLLIPLGFAGALQEEISGSSYLLFLLIGVISILVILATFFKRYFHTREYWLLLFLISFSLLFFISSDTALRTNFILGNGDQNLEYYTFRSTEMISYWNPARRPVYTWGSWISPITLFYSMISITILPTVAHAMLGLDETWTFKILYPLVMSFVAIGLYKLYNTLMSERKAFLATFFFMAVSVGIGWGPARQNIAQLFYVLLFLLIFDKTIDPWKRNLIFAIFGFSLVISHYSLSDIFLFLVVFTWLGSHVVNYIKSKPLSYRPNFTLDKVIIYSTFILFWDVFVSWSAILESVAVSMELIISHIGNFFSIESRGTALQGLGLTASPTIFHQVSKYVFILTEFLLFLGFLYLFGKRRNHTDEKFGFEYTIISALNLAIIFMAILIPSLADTFLMSRFYQTTLIVLAPLMILGIEMVCDHIPRMRKQETASLGLSLIVLLSLFFFQSGFVYGVTKDENDYLWLSSSRWSNQQLYNHIETDQDVFGAYWLSGFSNVTSISVYADLRSSSSVLPAYGVIPLQNMLELSNQTRILPDAFIYLSRQNIVDGTMVKLREVWNTSQILSMLNDQNRVYSNGGSEIFKQ